MNVSKEIIELIDPKNPNLFKTCKQFYSYIDLFDRNYIVDYKKCPGCLKLNDRIYRMVNFDGSTDNLPKNLTHLIFGRMFNQQINNLPKNLKHLTFGVSFNQQINNLPETLTHLKLPDRYGDKIEDLNFPPRLRYIIW
jgi:hypothetical protein